MNAAEPGMVDLVGVGLNATDTVITLAKYPVSGSKVEYSGTVLMPGGQAATAVVACRRWGLTTRYVGSLGDDSAAALHYSAFAAAGVETHIVPVAGCASRQSLILVDATGERTVLWRRDHRLDLKPSDLRREWITGARALHLDGYDTEAAILAAGWAREMGIPVIADLDELYPCVDELLALVDYPIVSRDFPCRLMHEPDLYKALRTMQRRYGATMAAVTLGAEGVLAWDGKRYRRRAAFQVPVVDTTGAGDLFHAGFVFGLLAGWELDEQLDFACAAAALNCTAVGARGGIGSREAIEALMDTGERYTLEE